MKRILSLLLAGVMVLGLASCNNKGKTDPSGSDPITSSNSTGLNPGDFAKLFTTGLTGDPAHYGDLEMMVLQDKSLVTPGGTAKLTVKLTNKGDKDVVFVKGSSSNTVPDALEVTALGLSPKHKEGVSVMDFNLETLKPGDSAEYHIEFAVPEADALKTALETAGGPLGITITDDIVIPGVVIFKYSALDEGVDFDSTAEPAGYVFEEFFITIA